MTHYPLLDQAKTPADLRQLSPGQLPQLADELRQFLIESISTSGGHFAAGLGVVELTVALHYIYNTPDDRLVWDVGHQCYPHKVLTGRREQMLTIRKQGGLSGFLSRSESPYDAFGAGHSSTSISAALGMAMANASQGLDKRVVAIIGDGSMTAGLAYEAMNHAGDVGADLLVVLNDNEMSISENVGALSTHLARILAGGFYGSLREHGKQVLGKVPPIKELARRTEEHVKGMVVPGTLFEELGFNYIGPVDGHDVTELADTLAKLRLKKGPQLLHVVTQKGKGYARAEDNPIKYHGVTPFDPQQGVVASSAPKPITFTDVFSDWLVDMATKDERLVGITPAMKEGSGLVTFADQFPDRYVDVGIAEQHSITLAAGMATEGLKPVVAIYSTFLQRGYDQFIHDVCIQNLPVLFAIDRAGLVGADGATHTGAFDLSFLRCIPNLVLMAPADENETRQMLYTGFNLDQPAAVRYPRGSGPGVEIEPTMTALPVGVAERRRSGKRVAILSFGTLLEEALVAAESLDASVWNMRFVKPIDHQAIALAAAEHDLIVTLEENAISGGAGSAVAESLSAQALTPRLLHLGLADQFANHGSPAQVRADFGLDADSIVTAINNRLTPQSAGQTSQAGG
ncbi:MAG: 1-deoxy-D-xylulose-5-phosphate synthase [Immundisolibacteraceae bacterium]|nr:1-deoxy-D-xylulose-5-phosphate synthase [Immundisolibacteraceae bacterium]